MEIETPAEMEPEAPAGYGTPKAGTECVRCDDWGTVVIERGKTSYEVFCPVKECEAAERARQLRGRDDRDG